MKYITLLSSSFSGSTLLSILVTRGSKVVGFGDTYNYQFVDWSATRCTCGASPSYACAVRRNIVDKMHKQGCKWFSWETSNPTPLVEVLRRSARFARYSRSMDAYELYKRTPNPIRQRLFSRFYRENDIFLKSLETLGYEYYFDGSKNLARFELLRAVIDGVKVIHLIKNPYSYMYSEGKRKSSKDIFRRFESWVRYNSTAYSYRNILGDKRYMLVRFESLVSDPANTMSDIGEFIGVKYDGDGSKKINLEDIHVLGNSMKNKFETVEDKSMEFIGKLEKQHQDYVYHKVGELAWINDVYPDLNYSNES